MLLQSLFFVSALKAHSINVYAQDSINLSGEWNFALDPLKRGEQNDWHLKGNLKVDNGAYSWKGWDVVKVPHCWSLDNRYNFVGKAWYKKAFVLPESVGNKCARLQFDAVFYSCRIFVNGILAAEHEGGYTPFEIDITRLLKYPEVNVVAVEVDNSWDLFTIPGARTGTSPNDQLFPWYEFGGITRDVQLLVTNNLYISKQKIESTPDLKAGISTVKIISWITNKSYSDTALTISSEITSRANGAVVKTFSEGNMLSQIVRLKAYSTQKIEFNVTLPASEVHLWDFDNPNLYDVKTTLGSTGAFTTYFGIRKIEVSGAQMLINGEPFRVAGANRHSDHPIYGSSDPREVAELDMQLMRNGNMIMARLNHTPPNRSFIEWADENGFLIIGEIPNWHISPVHLENAQVRANFIAQTRELIERDWNSPSVIAWSTGNEYQSWTPEGDEWTKYQMEQIRNIDNTRLLTFVALNQSSTPENLKFPHDSFRYCDFLNINIYSSIDKFSNSLDGLHAKYPNKPIFISEFGQRADYVKEEDVRIKHLTDVINIIRKRPFVMGCSYWSFNDYKSRFSGTNPLSGTREWGIVDGNRKPRTLYSAFQRELSPVIISIHGQQINVQARDDFPAYTLKGYRLKISYINDTSEIFNIGELGPGKSQSFTISKGKALDNYQLVNPKGFIIGSNQPKKQAKK